MQGRRGCPAHDVERLESVFGREENSMVKPIRRVVAGNEERGVAVALSDAPSPDVRLDPARPGFAATRLWVTDATPARVKGVRETLNLPHTIEPPKHGSVCRVIEFPPEG